MVEESLKNSIQNIGFSSDEAEIYLYLSQNGPSPAGLVSKQFNINRMKAYRTLRSLEEKRFVESIIGRPIRFVAAPLEDVIERYLKKMKDNILNLESKESSLLDTWNSLSREKKPIINEPRFRIFQGRQQIYDLMLQMTNSVQHELTIITTPRDLNRLSYMGFDDRLIELSEKGKRINLITRVETSWIEDIEYYNDFLNVRHIELPTPIRVLIVDDKETITTVAMDDTMSMTTKDDTGLWTDSASFVIAMKVFFESLWNVAQNAENMIQYLKSGEDPQEIHIINSMDEYLSTFQSMIERSRFAIDMMVKHINDLPLSLIDLVSVLETDVKIRLLTQVELENFPEIDQIPSNIIIKHNPSETGLFLLIVDRSKIIFNIPNWKVMGQAVWSNLDSYVGTMLQLFEDFWNNSHALETTIIMLEEVQNYKRILKSIKMIFINAGWKVTDNGTLQGTNNLTYNFSLVCSNPQFETSIGLELVLEDDIFSNIIRLGTYRLNLKQHIFLVSLRPQTTQEINLAKIYNIKLLYFKDPDELSKKLLEYIEKPL